MVRQDRLGSLFCVSDGCRVLGVEDEESAKRSAPRTLGLAKRILERMLELARILAILAGILVVGSALLSALRTFVLPRSSRDPVTATLFRFTAFMFKQGTRRSKTYALRDRIMALYAPGSLLLLPVV